MNYELTRQFDCYIKQNHYRLINSVLFYRGGKIVLERYYNKFDENSRNRIKSIWKSVLSICAGICVDKGYIKSVDEPISRFLPEFDRNVHPYHKLITVRHLLTMTSGIYWNGGVHYHCPMLEQWFRSKNQAEYLADIQMADVPGIRFVYKEWDVILLSMVIAAASGMNTYDFCEKYLYKPLDIKSGRWRTTPCGICYSISDSSEEEARSDLSARDLAKLGFLFLRGGVYNGERIVSKEYVDTALSPSPCNPGYGFLLWLSDGGFSCRGYGGQEINVLPDEDIVFVIQATVLNTDKRYGDVFRELAGLAL